MRTSKFNIPSDCPKIMPKKPVERAIWILMVKRGWQYLGWYRFLMRNGKTKLVLDPISEAKGY